jgi:predicted MFS family arabinose efflux permease
MTTASEWRAHWKVAAGSLVGMGTAFALYQYVSSLFLKDLAKEFGWSRGEISGAFAMGLIGALCAPLIGRVVDKVGVRPVITVCTLLVAAVYVGLANMPGELPVFFALMAALAIVGSGSGALAHTRVINSWFERNRGLALGVAIAGTSVFAIIMPPILTAVMTTWDWRAGYYALAILAAVIGLPIVLATVWERREAVKAGRTPALETDGGPVAGATFAEALRMKDYWLLAAAMLLVNISGAGLLSQMAPLLTDKGLTMPVAALLLSVFAASVLIGRVGTGWLVDRMSPNKVAFVFIGVLPAIGCVLLWLGAPTQAVLAVAVLGVVLLGLQQGSEMDLLGFFVARSFGMKTYSSIFGSMISVIAVSSAAGVALFGQAHDRTGSYDVALLASAIAFPLAGLCFLALGRPAAPASVALDTSTATA